MIQENYSIPQRNKRPGETITRAWQYLLPSDVTITSVDVSAFDQTTGLTDNTVLESTTATVVNSSATYTEQGGTDAHDYLLTFTATLSDGEVWIDKLLLRVRER